jgi:hypothetical protein
MGRGEWAAAVERLEKSKLYPEKLGTGAPFAPDVRLQDYLEALCQDKLGNKSRAEAIRKSILDYSYKHWDERGPGSYFGALVLERSGDEAKAREIFKWATPPQPEVLASLKRLK